MPAGSERAGNFRNCAIAALVEHSVLVQRRITESFREQGLRKFDEKVIIVGSLGVDGVL
jgi:hypothetical protein